MGQFSVFSQFASVVFPNHFQMMWALLWACIVTIAAVRIEVLDDESGTMAEENVLDDASAAMIEEKLTADASAVMVEQEVHEQKVQSNTTSSDEIDVENCNCRMRNGHNHVQF